MCTNNIIYTKMMSNKVYSKNLYFRTSIHVNACVYLFN